MSGINIWTKERVRKELKRNPKAVTRGILALYDRQTDDERVNRATSSSNGMGFNSHDAAFLSSLAMQIYKKGFLTEEQLKKGRESMLKYSGQIARLVEDRYAKA